MDYKKYASQGRWTRMALDIITHPSRLKAVLAQLQRLLTREGLSELADDVRMLAQYVKDVACGTYKDYDTTTLLKIVAIIAYIAAPADAIPDFIPGGLIDDASLAAWALKEFSAEIERYKKAL